MTKTKIQWKTEKRDVTALNDWDRNPRTISEVEFEKLKESIIERGFHDVLKIDTDGTIISGHQRKRALTELGILEVEVLVPNRALTEQERDIIAVESNRHRGTFDFDILANSFEVDDLITAGFNRDELFGTTTPEEEGDGSCARCKELKDMVKGHEGRTGHKVMEEPQE